MNQSPKPSANLSPARGAPSSIPSVSSALSGAARPMGLLYTLLRHGRGLSHEEAHRMSFEHAGGQPPKAA